MPLSIMGPCILLRMSVDTVLYTVDDLVDFQIEALRTPQQNPSVIPTCAYRGRRLLTAGKKEPRLNSTPESTQTMFGIIADFLA